MGAADGREEGVRTTDFDDAIIVLEALLKRAIVKLGAAEINQGDSMKSPWKAKRIQQQQGGGEVDILDLILRRKDTEELERIAAEGGRSRLKDTARLILEERQRQGECHAQAR